MSWNFEDYTLETGFADARQIHFSSLKEFFALSATGPTREIAVQKLRVAFDRRVAYLREAREPIPTPGGPPQKGTFAKDDEIRSLALVVDEFWREIFNTSYATSFVSDESTLASWEHYCQGGRQEIIGRVKRYYGTDISDIYDLPIPHVLRSLKANVA
jgi:hypothetical protein